MCSGRLVEWGVCVSLLLAPVRDIVRGGGGEKGRGSHLASCLGRQKACF